MTQPEISFGRLALVGGLMVAIGPISLALYTPALPTIAHAFDTSPSAVRLTLTSYFAGYAFAQLICGPLSDAYGRRPIVLAFIGIYVLGSIACTFSPTIELLIAARLVQGCGAAAGIAIVRAMVRDRFVGQESARLFNLIQLTLAIGPAMSPTIGALLLSVADWHVVFVAMLAYGLVLFALVLTMVRETLHEPDPTSLRPRRIGTAMLSLVTSATFMRPSLLIGMTLGAVYAMMSFMPFVLIEQIGLSELGFAAFMLSQTIAYILGTLATQALLRWFRASTIMVAGVWTVVLAAAIFAIGPRVSDELHLIMLIVPTSFWAIGVAFIIPGATMAALTPFPHIAGSASAMLGFMQIGGGFLGSAVAAAFADPVSALDTLIPAMALIGAFALLLPTPPDPPVKF